MTRMDFYEDIIGVSLIQNKIYEDYRGSFEINYLESEMIKRNFNNLIQSNFVLSKKALTFRGLHLQKEPYSQSKLVKCLNGSVIDIVFDVRKNSKTYLTENYFLLTSHDSYSLLVPKGCAHGYITLKDDTIISYFVDNLYDTKSEITIGYNTLNLSNYLNKERLVMSDKDRNAQDYNSENLND